MLEREEVEQYLNDFASEVVKIAWTNANKFSGRGRDSIGYELEVFKNSISLAFEMEDYMIFQDRGVRGVRSGESLSGFSYRNKMPPPRAFDRWSIGRGIAPRDRLGRFTPRKGINFAIARAIYLYGIEPKKFFTTAFEREFKDLPDEIADAYALEVEKLMQTTLSRLA